MCWFIVMCCFVVMCCVGLVCWDVMFFCDVLFCSCLVPRKSSGCPASLLMIFANAGDLGIDLVCCSECFCFTVFCVVPGLQRVE